MSGQSSTSEEAQVGKVYRGPDGKRYWVKEPEPILFNTAELVWTRPPIDYGIVWLWSHGVMINRPQSFVVSAS